MAYLAGHERVRFRRSVSSGSILLPDVDRFRSINDEYSHESGDRMLSMVAGIIRDELSARDIIGRWGGEAVLPILPDTDSKNARASAERVAVFQYSSREILQNPRVSCCGGCNHGAQFVRRGSGAGILCGGRA